MTSALLDTGLLPLTGSLSIMAEVLCMPPAFSPVPNGLNQMQYLHAHVPNGEKKRNRAHPIGLELKAR